MQGGVSTVSTQALIAQAAREGLDPTTLLAGTRVDRATLEDPSAFVPFADVLPIWEQATTRSSAPLGLRAAASLPFGAYRVIDFLCWSSPNVCEGVTKLARYMPLINDAVEMDVGDEGDPITVVLRSQWELPRCYAAFVFAAMIVRQRVVHTEPVGLSRLYFRGPAPGGAEELARTFDCEVVFESDDNAMEFSRADWERPLHPSDPSLFATLVEHADRLLADKDESDVSGRAAQAIARELRGGDASLERVARTLAMSERSLQRHLKEAGTSFAALLEAQRKAAAHRYLARGNFSVHEVGHLLGFSGPNSFARAFKRWTGMTPGQYRDQAASR